MKASVDIGYRQKVSNRSILKFGERESPGESFIIQLVAPEIFPEQRGVTCANLYRSDPSINFTQVHDIFPAERAASIHGVGHLVVVVCIPDQMDPRNVMLVVEAVQKL